MFFFFLLLFSKNVSGVSRAEEGLEMVGLRHENMA